MQDLLAYGREVLASQAFSQLIGARLDQFVPGMAELSIALHESLTQQHGFAHGGVLSYLADNALTFAGGSMLGDCLTAEYKINYLRPAQGERLVARAKVLSSGRRQAVCRCDVLSVSGDKEQLVAVAQGTIIAKTKGATTNIGPE